MSCAALVDIQLRVHSLQMSYRRQGDRDWGVLVVCPIAVPLAFVWVAIAFVGGSLVCGDAAAHCDGIVWPLVQGMAVIAAVAAALAWIINFLIRAFARACAKRP